MTVKTYNTIRKQIQDGTYKLVRLIEKKESGNPVIHLPFNSVSGGKDECLARLDLIRMRCNSHLPNGEYVVQCRISPQNTQVVDEYPVTVNKVYLINPNNVEDKTGEQMATEQITLTEYIELVHKNAELTSRISQLEYELKEAQKSTTALADAPPAIKDGMTILGEILSESMPSLVNLGDRYFAHKDKSLELEHKKLESGLIKKQMNHPKKKLPQKSFEQEIQEEVDYLNSIEDEGAFNAALDELQQEDPELYEEVVKELDLEDEEDGEGEEGDHAE